MRLLWQGCGRGPHLRPSCQCAMQDHKPCLCNWPSYSPFSPHAQRQLALRQNFRPINSKRFALLEIGRPSVPLTRLVCILSASLSINPQIAPELGVEKNPEGDPFPRTDLSNRQILLTSLLQTVS